MSETTLPKRQAVDQQLTWDLTPIFNDDFAYTEAVKQVRALTKDFVRMYQGKLTQPAVIADALADYGTIVALASRIIHWGFMPYSTDTTDPALRTRQAQVTGLDGEISGQLSFFEPNSRNFPKTCLMQLSRPLLIMPVLFAKSKLPNKVPYHQLPRRC